MNALPVRARRPRFVAAAVAVSVTAVQFVTAIPAQAVVTGNSPAVTEPGDSGLTRLDFVITRASGDPTTMNYQTVPETGGGKATEGSDYLPTDGTLVFAAAELEKHVRVDVLGDTLNEGDETLTLRLTNTSDASQLAVATGTIHDDNDPAPAVSVADTATGEGNTGTNGATFSVTLNRQSGQTVTVNYTTDNGTAAAPGDFTPTTGTLTFDPGELAETVTVPVAGDVLDEDDETFTLKLSAATGGATINRGTATGRILDDDEQPVVSIADVTVAENAGPANFVVSLSAASGRAVTVHATTLSGTAFPGSDFEGQSGEQVTIPAGDTQATFPVPIVNNDANESTETFSVELSPGANALIGRATATGTITDDDAGPKLSINDVSIAENALPPTADFTVTLAGASAQPVTVAYTTVDGTAKNPADYTVASGVLTFTPGITTRHVLVPIVNEAVKELDENFTVKLSTATNAELADDIGLGTIQNDDGPPAILTVSDPTVSEAAGTATFTVSLSGPVAQPVVVNYQTKDATALATRDYDSRAGTITFLPNDVTPKTVDVPVTADALDEIDETFTFELSDPVNAAFSDGVGTATITDDDAAPTVIVDAIPPIDEGDADSSNATVAVRLSAESGKEVKLDFTVVDGTATAGKDYTAPAAGQLVFSPGSLLPGETVENIPVAAVGDELYEGNETFLIRFASADGTATVPPALAAPNGATVTIADNDAKPTVGIYDAEVEEPQDNSDTVLRFPVRLSAPSGRAVTVTVTDTDDSATEGSDYDALPPPGTVTIPAGAQAGYAEFQVNGDVVGANDAAIETFTVTLSSPQDADLDPAHTTATGTIFDEDGPPTLRITGTTVGEGVVGGKATVTVELFPASTSPTPITVDYATSDGTAKTPADYTGASGPLSFTTGQTVKTFDVTVAPDAVDEVDEAFTVSLANEQNAGVGQRTATVNILDDDGPVVSVAGLSVTEGNVGTKTARFLVSLSAASPQGVSVSYATSSGTASSPGDFTATSGTQTFAPGEVQKFVDVPVIGDTLDEADEDFTLALGNPVNATAGPPGRATIVDDDQPNVTVAASVASPDDPSVTEGNIGVKAMTFTVRLDAPTTRDVVVDYATADGTARAGTDYLATSGRLTFAPGEVSKSLLVAVLGDERDEVDETVALRLPSAVNGTIIDATTLGTILDDDGPGYFMVATDG
ncbi:MAG: Calx-beta domain-containing protein, partial [Nocardioidaceae bacterium]